MVQCRAARFVKIVPHPRTKPPTSASAMVRLGTISNPQTPWQVEHVFQDHSRHGCTPCGVSSSSTAPAGSSRSLPAIPASSAVCLQVRLLSKNQSSLESSPNGASGGQIIGGVQAASAVTLDITTSCVYTARTVFLHLFLFEFIYALLPHCTFCHRCSL